MKILLVHNYYQQRGGEDNVFESECTMLRTHGHDVETLVFRNDDIQSAGDKIKAGLSGFYNPESCRRLEEVISRFKPDVMHVHNFFPLASPQLFSIAKKHNVGTVLTLHNYRLICANGLLFRDGGVCEDCVTQKLPVSGVLHSCYRDSRLQTLAVAVTTAYHGMKGTWHHDIDQYITLTGFSKNRLVHSALGLPKEKITVKPNFVDDPGDNPHRAGGYFLYAGRLVPEKGIEVLLEVWDEKKPLLKIAGTGPMEEIVQEAARRHENIEFLGFQPRQNILDLMKQTTALLFPTLWYEGFPITLLEALATATPVICSRIGGLPEIIEDGSQGLLFTPGNASELNACIERLSSVELQKEISRRAREKFLAHYSAGAVYPELIAIYKRVCRQR